MYCVGLLIIVTLLCRSGDVIAIGTIIPTLYSFMSSVVMVCMDLSHFCFTDRPLVFEDHLSTEATLFVLCMCHFNGAKLKFNVLLYSIIWIMHLFTEIASISTKGF